MDAALEYRHLVIAAGHVDQTEKAWAFSLSPATIQEAIMISLQVIDQIAYIIQVAGLATVTSCMRLEINEYKDDMHRMT